MTGMVLVRCNECGSSFLTLLKPGIVKCVRDYMDIVEMNLKEHKELDGCDCPFPCPSCKEGTCAWDMGAEGHFCSRFSQDYDKDGKLQGCDYYDGYK